MKYDTFTKVYEPDDVVKSDNEAGLDIIGNVNSDVRALLDGLKHRSQDEVDSSVDDLDQDSCFQERHLDFDLNSKLYSVVELLMDNPLHELDTTKLYRRVKPLYETDNRLPESSSVLVNLPLIKE